jgi:6-pyruvoyltetrahydropterin/6-carboxytetrahydropterin synthase
MITCSKTYRDIPFAHRQHRHEGHCSFLHGHNWSVEIEFACSQLDERGFVVDFGGLGYLKDGLPGTLTTPAFSRPTTR